MARQNCNASIEQSAGHSGSLQQAIREEERARIAREIHDELGQALTGLKFDLAWLKTGLMAHARLASASVFVDRINDMSATVQATIQTVRQIATDLRPPLLDELGLVAALEWQAQDFGKRTGIHCTFKAPPAPVDIDGDLSIAVFRIYQEALTNVARHAAASQVTIVLQIADDCLILEVSDNGKGMKRPSKPSLGLLGMKERVESLGGIQQITSVQGRGTRIATRIPLAATARTLR